MSHRVLMIQGFELSFVAGFLLTAMPGLTKAAACSGGELAIAVAASLVLVVAGILGSIRTVEIATIISILLLVFAFARRLRSARAGWPAEAAFIGFGLLAGLIGALWQAASGHLEVFAGRLLSLGLVLSLVLGLGGLLVPAFIGIPAPLSIPGISGAHERARRSGFYLVVLAALTAAFVAEFAGQARLGAALRAGAATVMVVWVWKLIHLPRRHDAPAWSMWISGWMVLIGLWLAVVIPSLQLAALHLVFIGGFSMLTLGIGTRVVVAHGQYPFSDERRVLPWLLIALIAAALIARLAAELAPARSPVILSASALFWIAAWLIWAWRAVPRVVTPNKT